MIDTTPATPLRPRFSLPTGALATGPVNGVIGDESFIRSFGTAPTEKTDEQLRIATHLAYVETLLEARDVSDWPESLQSARRTNIRRLRDYRLRGVFPRNFSSAETRKPCFIDPLGRICAVGYLLERSSGRAAAEEINRQFQYARLAEMESEALDSWAETTGLTRRELAMIQPFYGPPNSLLLLLLAILAWLLSLLGLRL